MKSHWIKMAEEKALWVCCHTVSCDVYNFLWVQK